MKHVIHKYEKTSPNTRLTSEDFTAVQDIFLLPFARVRVKCQGPSAGEVDADLVLFFCKDRMDFEPLAPDQ